MCCNPRIGDPEFGRSVPSAVPSSGPAVSARRRPGSGSRILNTSTHKWTSVRFMAVALTPILPAGGGERAPSEPNGPARTDAVPAGGGPSSFLVRAARGGFNRSMGDKTIIKVDSTHSPHGPLGQTYLATGVGVGMRLWRDRPPGPPVPEVARDYETVGYVISGRAELHSEGQMVLLEPGNAWVVPRHARHTYKILEPFTAVEATHPPAEIHDRDRPVGQGNRSDAEQDSG